MYSKGMEDLVKRKRQKLNFLTGPHLIDPDSSRSCIQNGVLV